jgi:hypothetical protein
LEDVEVYTGEFGQSGNWFQKYESMATVKPRNASGEWCGGYPQIDDMPDARPTTTTWKSGITQKQGLQHYSNE